MAIFSSFYCLLATLVHLVLSLNVADPFLIDNGDKTFTIGNSLWNLTLNSQFGTKLLYKGHDLVGAASGHYVSYNGAANNLTFDVSPPRLQKLNSEYTSISFLAKEGLFVWVLSPTLSGAYQYFVNHNLPQLGEFRTLWRLDNSTFTHAWTSEIADYGVKEQIDGVPLVPLSQIRGSNSTKKVQDETWQRLDGSFITKYDLAAFLPVVEGRPSLWGTLGKLPGTNEGIGSWYIHGGKDYLNGDHLKQELMNHRESITGDTVQLNMIHGTHFQSISRDNFARGRTWGPFLWYLNNGSSADALAKAKEEMKLWPYQWMKDDNGFNSRGNISGQLSLDGNRPASNAAIFLGDNNSTLRTVNQGAGYYYRTYADHMGRFRIDNVRSGSYALQAWPNGGIIADVFTTFVRNDVVISANKHTALPALSWATQGRKKIWQIGELDRTGAGFNNSGPPHKHGRSANCPANLTYTVGTSGLRDWCFAMVKPGTWSIKFGILSGEITSAAVLSLALASFTSGVVATISINEKSVCEISQATAGEGDPSLYRSGTLAGDWRLVQCKIAKGLLREDQNSIDFKIKQQEREHEWTNSDPKIGNVMSLRGFMWDSIALEWDN
ncbi:hypothetical protein BT63DRAFT_25591 [Microthyrium microscopicum]|uniref:Rhamnogalacturonan endolyase n=1 Tax=Microthyrium microscopicum TaxID=703497 RepID=A0A6A6UV70_9PEZI|nr:hypothetical protein BT63DRAFT_25591 [Microthyrium microscopicum]